MNTLPIDRLSAILTTIDEWLKQDPRLRDNEGFLRFLKSCDIGKHQVGDVNVWMRYYHEARKKRVSVAELLFEKKSEMMSKRIVIEKDASMPLDERVFVIDEEKRRELIEMGERLKRDDPARRRRLNK